ncbi:MAG: ABC transporter ATP-binding protein [Firmicutes bacterium]|nr:ABC transporter ATP-binding protein [Bacillota bacterium]
MGFLELVNIKKSFDKTKVLEDINLTVEKGQFVSLLGASGSGKSTCLGIVAGFIHQDSGKVIIKGVDVSSFEPQERKIGMVFQDYALFPHMTVADNVAFGLKMRHCPLKERMAKVKKVLEIVGLEEQFHRLPKELSGGQQQRVALARALVLEPEILLLDEPLSNLDAKLRERMRGELRRIQREFGVTTLFVTHDQSEAMSLSDMIAVLDKGQIVQYGTPENLYMEPKNKFAADFIGRINFIEAVVFGKNDDISGEYLALDSGGRRWVGTTVDGSVLTKNQRVTVAFRPEDLTIVAEDAKSGDKEENTFTAEVVQVAYQGSFTYITLRVEKTGEEVIYLAFKNLEKFQLNHYLKFRVSRLQLLTD